MIIEFDYETGITRELDMTPEEYDVYLNGPA